MASFESIRAQLQPIPYPTSTFTGQTVIITGSNSGLGLEAARHFLRLGVSKLILAVRSIQKGEAAKASLEASSDRNNVIEVWLLDMLNYESILAFVSRCNTLDRLDVVVANAGVLKNTYEESGGTEITIKVNVIATFLLAIALFPALRKSTALTGHTGRIVVTSSVMHEQAKFSERHEPSIFESFNKDKKSYIADRYNTSKLLELLLVRSIAEAIENGPHSEEPVILNAVNPGLCYSSLDRDVKGLSSLVISIAKAAMARTSEVGSLTLVHAAGAGSESHGQYMSECAVKEPSKFVRSTEGAEIQQRVHRELMGILETIRPGISSNI